MFEIVYDQDDENNEYQLYDENLTDELILFGDIFLDENTNNSKNIPFKEISFFSNKNINNSENVPVLCEKSVEKSSEKVNFSQHIENIEKFNLNTKERKRVDVLAISTEGKSSRRNLTSKKEKKESENNFEVISSHSVSSSPSFENITISSSLESSACGIDVNAIAAEDQHSFNIFREKIKKGESVCENMECIRTFKKGKKKYCSKQCQNRYAFVCFKNVYVF
jgi:hypothetical protein